MRQHVIRYQSPRGNTIELCQSHINALRGDWPKDPTSGEEYCTVVYGLHTGACDRCQPREDA